jgi:hypothetical protein
MLRFRQSAFEHDITEDQIEEVLLDRWGMTKWFKIHDDDDGNSQDMAVGFDREGSPLEVGLTYINDDEVVFHADDVTPAWQIQYNED